MNSRVSILFLISAQIFVAVAATASLRITATSLPAYQLQSRFVQFTSTLTPTPLTQLTNNATSSDSLLPTPSVSSSQQSVAITSSIILQSVSRSILAQTPPLTAATPSSSAAQFSSSSRSFQASSPSVTLSFSTLSTAFPSPTPVATIMPSSSPSSFLSRTPVATTMPSSLPSSFLSPTPIATSTPIIPTTETTIATTSPTSVTNPIKVIVNRVGLFITVGSVLFVCIVLTAMCCCAIVCCICCYKLTNRNKSGYRRAEVLGNCPEEFNVNSTRFTYQRIQLGDSVPENVELVMLGAALEERRRKILPEHFKKHLDSLWAVELAELRDEFNMLEVSKVRQNSIVANLHNEIHKNKDFKLVPYDSNRVKLKNVSPMRSSDYINASFIRTPTIDQLFIAAQAPMEGTVNQFWQFVIEQNISNIVMLVPTGADQQTNLFPSQAHPVKLFEKLELSFEAEDQELCATFRRLKIKNDLGNIKHVVHGQFKDWIPKLGVPKFQYSFIKFIKSFKQKMIVDNSPVLVYSLTGCGQTGMFIATYNLMQVINMSMPVSVFDTVFRLLEQRVCIIQSLEEYKFLHLAVLEMIYDSTELLANEFPDAYRSYTDSLRDSYRSIFHMQFSELDYQVEKTHKRSQEEALDPVNRTKNTTQTVLPYDDTRVSLFSEFWEAGDYINASYIDGYKKPQYYIATSHPIRETILEFLQMVYQSSSPLVLLLATEDEFSLLQTGLDGSVCYWSEEKQGFGMYSVENLGSTNSAGLVRNKIKITNHSESSTHTFVQYICTNFLDNSKPTNSQAVIHLSELISKFKQEYTASPVVVHCWDGIGKTGLLIACSIAMQQLASEDKVDMFHIVKGMRRGREKMVSPVDLYIACFDVIKDLIVKTGQNSLEAQTSEFTVKVNV